MTINMVLEAFQSRTGSEMDALHCNIANLNTLLSIKKYVYNHCSLHQNHIHALHFCRNRYLLIFHFLLAI